MSLLDRTFAAAYARWAPRADAGRLGRQRAELLQHARGHVLEIGAGTGSNLPALVHPEITRITLTEPSRAMARHLRRAAAEHPSRVPVEVLEAPAQALPVPDASVDTLVCTLVLCSVTDLDRALGELRRVLRPDGTLLLLEHVAGTGALRGVQGALEPAWRVLGRGCHLTRDTRGALARAGFVTDDLVLTRLAGGGPAAPAIMGAARPG
jgi:ubiquinone/menaquinone biosynthesis C-methylase UbiE